MRSRCARQSPLPPATPGRDRRPQLFRSPARQKHCERNSLSVLKPLPRAARGPTLSGRRKDTTKVVQLQVSLVPGSAFNDFLRPHVLCSAPGLRPHRPSERRSPPSAPARVRRTGGLPLRSSRLMLSVRRGPDLAVRRTGGLPLHSSPIRRAQREGTTR